MSETRILPSERDDETLVAELNRLGVRHLARLSPGHAAYNPMEPADLLVILAKHPQSRFRSSLILLFLSQPSYGDYAQMALDKLSGVDAHTLRFYYQAAVYLQRELQIQLKTAMVNWQELPDLFSGELGSPPADSILPEPHGADGALAALGEAHHQATGLRYNWAASYRQHIPLFIKRLVRTRGHLNP